MTKWEKWSLHLLTVGVSLSGLIYFWMKYLLETEDPFSVLNHPRQAETLDLHLILSPALVFVLGMVSRSHVSRKLQQKTQAARRSGLVTLFSFPLMVLSGYLPQILSDRSWIDPLLVLHLVSGGIFSGSYLCHFGTGLLGSRTNMRFRQIRPNRNGRGSVNPSNAGLPGLSRGFPIDGQRDKVEP